jgi:hypothetical protein
VSDPFDELLERWLRERGRSDRESLVALAGHVAVLPPRRTRPRGPLLAAAMIVVVVVAVAFVASTPRTGQIGVGADAAPSDAKPAPSPSTHFGKGVATPSPAPARTRPPWAADLNGALDCDGSVQDVGGEAGEFDLIWISGSASPSFWLDHLDTVDLPLTGWVEDPDVPETGAGTVRFVNAVEGRIKAVILMVGFSPEGGSGRWAIAGYRACPPSEFDPLRGTTLGDAPWRDPSGTVIRLARAVNGPAHCGWESTIFLRIDGRTYIRDPLGLFADRTVGSYLADTLLPADAVSTGLTSAGRELFMSPDVDSAWIRVGELVERWPRAPSEIGCA